MTSSIITFHPHSSVIRWYFVDGIHRSRLGNHIFVSYAISSFIPHFISSFRYICCYLPHTFNFIILTFAPLESRHISFHFNRTTSCHFVCFILTVTACGDISSTHCILSLLSYTMRLSKIFFILALYHFSFWGALLQNSHDIIICDSILHFLPPFLPPFICPFTFLSYIPPAFSTRSFPSIISFIRSSR